MRKKAYCDYKHDILYYACNHRDCRSVEAKLLHNSPVLGHKNPEQPNSCYSSKTCRIKG